MRIANLDGRATLVTDRGLVDIEQVSEGKFSANTDELVSQLDALQAWVDEADPEITRAITVETLLEDERLGPVIRRPSQLFAIGLNYRLHAREMNLTLPDRPMVFAKFASSLAGANARFPIPSSRTDYEAELVVVIGKQVRDARVEDALSYVAGYCVGQDLSDRELQLSGASPQYSLGKSFENFSPIGPWLTTSDEVGNPNDLEITCEINGRRFQDSNTSDMVYSVAELVAYVSSVCELRPGDLIFTGSPAGVGQGQKPPRFLQPGDVVCTAISKLGSIRNSALPSRNA